MTQLNVLRLNYLPPKQNVPSFSPHQNKICNLAIEMLKKKSKRISQPIQFVSMTKTQCIYKSTDQDHKIRLGIHSIKNVETTYDLRSKKKIWDRKEEGRVVPLTKTSKVVGMAAESK